MRSSLRGLAATVCTSVVALSLPVLAVLATPVAAEAAAPSDVQITEWAYNGIEFFELTNLGRGGADLTGWSYSDSARLAGTVDLSAFGRVAPGESVLVSELTAADFRAAWSLPDTVKVIGDNKANLGRSDEINLYDASDALVDRLTYDDQGTDPNKGPRTDTSSAWVPQAALGLNTASAWTKSTAADAEASWQSTTVAGFYGSPGISTLGGYDAQHNNSAAGSARITEWAYNGIEFFELTNVGSGAQDFTGWSFSDSGRTPGAVDLSGFGTVAAGESVIVTELSAAAFRTAWGLDDTVKVIGGNSANLGRSDEINIYDAADALVDRLTFNDQGTDPNKGPRTDTASAWVPAPALGKNTASSWTKSTLADDEDSWESTTTGFFGSPGVSNFGFEHVAEPSADSVRINEIESNGDPVGDWVELTNIGATAVDVSGWKLRDGGGSNPTLSIPAGTTIAPGAFYAIYTEIPPPGFGLGVDDSVTLYLPDATTVVDNYAWSGGHAATTYGRCADGTGEFRVTTVGTRGGPNACSPIRVNEVQTSASPDKVEIVNISASPVDLGGWVLKDSTDASPTTLPSPSVVPAHGYLVVEPNATLDPADSVRLYDGTSALIDTATWTSEPTPSLGRCADGVGAFKLTSTATIGATNSCPGVVAEAWPGSPTVTVSDDAGTFNQDASGLAFDPTDAGTLWVAQNKLGTLWKMTKSGSTWVPAAGWSKTPKYNDGGGAPDSEGITVGPDGAVYLATERDNDVSGVSKNAVLRYDANGAAGSTLNATDEWDINPLLPSLGANLGLEGITWVPDSYLVDGGFIDESTSAAYAPSHYPDHGTGLYVVAVEGTGLLYVLALDQTAAVHETAHLVATVDPRLLTNAGPPGVMDVSYDAEQKRLWAVCDDSCDGTTVLLTLSGGKFVVEHAYERPAGMPNLNNEGFALAPQSTCVTGKKEVVWSDDGDTDNHSLRSGTFPCDQPTVTASDTSVAYGKPALIPVEVTVDGVTPTGSVSLLNGEDELGTATLTAGRTSIPVPAKSLEPGTHSLTVAYAGDDHVAPGSDSMVLTVTKAVGSVSATNASAVYGAATSIPVTVTADGVPPTGSVSVRDGASVLGSADLVSGQATVSVPAASLRPGTHSLTVAYAGDGHVAAANGTVTVTVAKVDGAVSATGGSVVYGKAASIPVTVTGAGGTATGTVTVSSGATVLGSATVTGGAATVAIRAKSLAPGAHSLTVAYGGDGVVEPGTTTASLRVSKARATVAKPASSPKQVVVKKTRAKVMIKVSASGVTPTGKVTISGGGIPKRTVTLRGGKAVVKLPVFKSKGAKRLTVTYLGDRFVRDASSRVTIQVKPRKK